MRVTADTILHAAQPQTSSHSSKGHGSIEVSPSSDHEVHEDPFIRSMNDDSKGNVHLFQVSTLKFSPDGCDIMVVGSHGEILCLDSLSAATLWSIPPHLDQLREAHLCMSTQASKVPELLLVDEYGLVRALYSSAVDSEHFHSHAFASSAAHAIPQSCH